MINKIGPHKITELDCSRCTLLTTIPQLANLERLYCNGCTSLMNINDLENLQKLYCDECPSLSTITFRENDTNEKTNTRIRS